MWTSVKELKQVVAQPYELDRSLRTEKQLRVIRLWDIRWCP